MSRPVNVTDWSNHRQTCPQCRDHPEQLCNTGYLLLSIAAIGPKVSIAPDSMPRVKITEHADGSASITIAVSYSSGCLREFNNISLFGLFTDQKVLEAFKEVDQLKRKYPHPLTNK